jgi:hypothetical protein
MMMCLVNPNQAGNHEEKMSGAINGLNLLTTNLDSTAITDFVPTASLVPTEAARYRCRSAAGQRQGFGKLAAVL